MSMLAAEKYGADVTSYGLVRSQNDGMRMLMRSRKLMLNSGLTRLISSRT